MAAVRRVAVGLVMLLAVAGCGANADPAPGDRPTDGPKIVTTVAPITDIVTQIAGPDLAVTGVVPAGTDSHTFEPGPAVAREFVDARLFVANGLFLEEPALALAEANLPPEGEIITLADRVVTEDEWVFDFSFPEQAGQPNPHLWTSPPLARRYAEIIAGELARIDPDRAERYQRRYDEYAAQLSDLDRAIATAVGTIPPESRRLLTYHDSFPYFAPHYGFEVIGAIQPSDFAEPSAAEVARLIDQIRAEQVPAVFGSEVFPSDVLAQIAAETDAVYVDDLRDDELPGEPGDPEHSYLGMMVFNARTIVQALGGDAAALAAVDPGRAG